MLRGTGNTRPCLFEYGKRKGEITDKEITCLTKLCLNMVDLKKMGKCDIFKNDLGLLNNYQNNSYILIVTKY